MSNGYGIDFLGVCIVQLKNDEASWNELNRIVGLYYSKQGRQVSVFRPAAPTSNDSLEFCFLLDRKHVVKYVIGFDRGGYLGVLLLGIGSEYFSPADFWSYQNSERFALEADAHGVVRNLRLLDEFLGYPERPLFIP